MSRRLTTSLIVAFSSLMTPLTTLAQEESKIVDARLEGYSKNVTLDAGGTALIWLLVLALAALGVGVLFKNANRSHLD